MKAGPRSFSREPSPLEADFRSLFLYPGPGEVSNVEVKGSRGGEVTKRLPLAASSVRNVCVLPHIHTRRRWGGRGKAKAGGSVPH